ncbi:MAG: ferritin, partial [Anaerolineae bacterium]|nr:ferritin [Anaerolineae bacterium]
ERRDDEHEQVDEEEREHALKILDYVPSVEGHVKVTGIPEPTATYPSVLAAIEAALAHERKVTEQFNVLMSMAVKESDYATDSFLKWFVDEQVEEEQIVDAIIQDLEHIGDFGPGLYMLDRELARGGEEEAESGDAT